MDQLDLTGPSGSSFWLPNNYGFNSLKDSVSVNLDDMKIQNQCRQSNLTDTSRSSFWLPSNDGFNTQETIQFMVV